MKLFQNSGLYPAYLPRLRELTRNDTSFAAQVATFLSDRYGAVHFLQPVLAGDESAFFTNGDDEVLQRQWAKENGMHGKPTLAAILLAQIEHNRTEVFYNMDPMRYGSDFVRRLPGCVRKSIAWRAAPSPGADFEAYDLIVCNFPSILESYRARGWNAQYFSPAHDPVMDKYASNSDRPIDVLFVGGYSRHHRRRAEVLEAVAGLSGQCRVEMYLDRSRMTKLCEVLPAWLPFLTQHRRPSAIRAASRQPVFGRDLYRLLSQSKIVLNGAVDMAGPDRGNMRCWEAMGCGALLVSDSGNYPSGMVAGQSMMNYLHASDAVKVISHALSQPNQLKAVATGGYDAVHTEYSKRKQWGAFERLVENAQ